MTLAAGNKLGSYEIVAQIGKGGMGEVYRARDTKLNRDVALKVLPAEFANDAERMARFKREAQLLASLNHPNIAAIYGLEESGGVRALIMELAEGPTLAERLVGAAGRPPVLDEILSIARQIAEALEAAHEKGIIHRDLKPANIKVTPEGAVKVLDFGLAKALEGEASVADASESPTLSLAATRAGVILGTAAYMSPEQARGAAVDKRCDIWSFGVVLFEMLTGKQLFAGETVSDTIAAVLRADIDWNLLPANTPPSIRTLLRRCLTKDRKQRLQAIGEARIIIEDYLANPASASLQETASITGSHKFRERLAWGAIVLLVTALTVLGIVYYRKISEPPQFTKLEYTLPEDQQFSHTEAVFLAISPDGRKFAYNTNKGLYLRSLDDWAAKRIVEASEDPSNPFFSPDGNWIGYRSVKENKLKKVPVKEGAPIALCDVGAFSGAFWGADDTITLGEYGKGMVRVSANGGNSEVLFKGDASFYFHPQLLPDGKSLLFTLHPYPYRIAARSLLGSLESKPIIPQGARAFYLPTTGHLVYGLGNRLYAISFDPSKLMTAGATVPMVEGVSGVSVSGGLPQYDVSPSGTLIYVQGATIEDSPKRTLIWVTRNGKEESLGVQPDSYESLRISPNGERVALHALIDGNRDIYIWDLVGKIRDRLTHDKAIDVVPLWSRDGRKVAFMSDRKGGYGVYWIAADGTGKEKLLSLESDKELIPSSWSRDGKILVMSVCSGINWDIGMLSVEGDPKYQPLLHEKYQEFGPQIHPDGQWIAYVSNETGMDEIYVRTFPEVDKGRWRVSSSGGDIPLWSRDGRELFWRSGDAIMAAAVKTDPSFRFEKPEIIFRGKFVSSSSDYPHPANNPWDISLHGERFLMMKETGSTESSAQGPRKINVILNWFEELKQKAPVK
jgi:eukaryotic-like serine/threonine-protein kinase